MFLINTECQKEKYLAVSSNEYIARLSLNLLPVKDHRKSNTHDFHDGFRKVLSSELLTLL